MDPHTTLPDLMLEDEALRDGLQMESRIFSLEEKLRLFRLMQNAGVKRIQVGSFVHPRIVPQMADTDELPKSNALLYAKYGKGHYVYCALSLFRQLPAGVPGGMKIMANLVSIGR